MEILHELREITMLPVIKNNGHLDSSRVVYSVTDKDDGTTSYPIFTAPMDSVVGKETIKNYIDNGIRPILPATEPIGLRVEYSQWIFCAFSLAEVKQYFLLQDRRSSGVQFHVCIDAGNGHDAAIFEVGKKIKQLYGQQVLLMGGNLGVPETYIEYGKALFDYVRVGSTSGSLVNRYHYGFHYPLASLLLGIKNLKTSAAAGIPKLPRIVADGGIEQQSDVLKAIALGADYVMIGREFARLVEAQGTVYKKVTGKGGKKELVEVRHEDLVGFNGVKARIDVLSRQYQANTSDPVRARRAGFMSVDDWKKTHPIIRTCDAGWEWVDIDCTLPEWVDSLNDCIYYGFMMTGSLCWDDFRKNVRTELIIDKSE